MERIIGYLESGAPVLFTSRCAFPDPIDGTCQEGSLWIRTDGEWVWYDDLGYYLRKYPFEIPDAFLARIRALDYAVPNVEGSDFSDLHRHLGWPETPFDPAELLNFPRDKKSRGA